MRSEPPHLLLGETCVYVCIAEPLAKNSLQEQLCLPMGLHSLKLRSTTKVTNSMYSKHDFVNLGETCWWERVRMQQECKPITCLATCKMPPRMHVWASLGLSGPLWASARQPASPPSQAHDRFPGRNSVSQPASQVPGRNSACG